MKTCPSCSRQVDESAHACPHCGHDFNSGAKRTMLGLPALSAEAEEDDIFGLNERPNATQFGIPAQSRDQSFDEESEPDWDEDDYDSTSIVPTEQLNFHAQEDALTFDPMRGTVSGVGNVGEAESEVEDDGDATGIANPNAFNAAWGLDEDSAPSRTSVAPANVAPADVSGGFAQFVPPQDSGHEVGTLLGMSLDELQEKQAAEEKQQRSTQFGLPAARRDSADESSDRTAVADADMVAAATASIPDPTNSSPATAVADANTVNQAISDLGLAEDSEEPEGDSPTQAWNPADAPSFTQNFGGEEKRKSKLEQLRAKKHLLKKNRDTASGIPSAPKPGSKDSVGPAPAAPKPADDHKQVARRQTQDTPSAQDDQRTSSISAGQLTSQVSATAVTDIAPPEAPALQNRGLETPSSGVLKVPKRTNPPGSLRAEDTGLLGGGSYSKSREEITSDEDAVPKSEAKVPVSSGPQPGVVPRPPQPLQAENKAPDTIPDAPMPSLPDIPATDSGLEEQSWKEEYNYDETGIVPSPLMEGRAGGPSSSPPPAASTSPEIPDFGALPSGPPAPAAQASAQPTPAPPAPKIDAGGDTDPDTFQASNSKVRPFTAGSTGTKFPTAGKPGDASYPAQRNTMDSSLPSSSGFQPQSGSFQAQQQKKGLEGMSATDLFSNLPDKVNTAPPGVAPPAQGPRTGALEPGAGIQNFDFSAPNAPPQAFSQPGMPQGPPQMSDPMAFQQEMVDAGEGVTKFIARAQSFFGIVGGLVMMVAMYLALAPAGIPENNMLAIALAAAAVSGLGSIFLSLFPISPGLRGVAFGILALAALAGFGVIAVSGGAANVLVVVLLLASAGLIFVSAIFPVIGKLVS